MNLCSAVYPLEMLGPSLDARVEQSHNAPRYLIKGRSCSALAQVAVRASKAEVVRSVAGAGIDVLDVHLLASVDIPGAAILAVALGASVDKTTEGGLR